MSDESFTDNLMQVGDNSNLRTNLMNTMSNSLNSNFNTALIYSEDTTIGWITNIEVTNVVPS